MTTPQPFSFSYILSLQRFSCFYCEKKIDAVGHSKINKNGYTRDHFIPRSWGHGLKGNTVMSCAKCNRKKNDLLPTIGEIVRFIKLYSHIKGGTSMDFTEFLFTQRIIDTLGKYCNPCVDTRYFI